MNKKCEKGDAYIHLITDGNYLRNIFTRRFHSFASLLRSLGLGACGVGVPHAGGTSLR